MSTTQTIKQNYGSSAMFAGAAVGGAVVASIAQNKIKFLDTILGRLVLIVLGIMLIAKGRSETMKGIGTGIAVSGSLGFVKSIAGSVNGFEGLAGVEGAGMGQIVQDENGMVYMVNGVGEIEEIPMMQGVGNDYEALTGLNGDENLYV
jgi:hypothetical protein